MGIKIFFVAQSHFGPFWEGKAIFQAFKAFSRSFSSYFSSKAIFGKFFIDSS